jgi:hypothetical protein
LQFIGSTGSRCRADLYTFPRASTVRGNRGICSSSASVGLYASSAFIVKRRYTRIVLVIVSWLRCIRKVCNPCTNAIRLKTGGQINSSNVRGVIVFARTSEARGGEAIAVSAFGRLILCSRVVVNRITLRAFVTYGLVCLSYILKIIWHMRETHGAGCVHQQHNIGLDVGQV